jgi:hypothetical protein
MTQWGGGVAVGFRRVKEGRRERRGLFSIVAVSTLR